MAKPKPMVRGWSWRRSLQAMCAQAWGHIRAAGADEEDPAKCAVGGIVGRRGPGPH